MTIECEPLAVEVITSTNLYRAFLEGVEEYEPEPDLDEMLQHTRVSFKLHMMDGGMMPEGEIMPIKDIIRRYIWPTDYCPQQYDFVSTIGES